MAVCKINIDSDLRLAMTAGVRQQLMADPAGFDPRGYLKVGRQYVKDLVKDKIVNVLGSDHRSLTCLWPAPLRSVERRKTVQQSLYRFLVNQEGKRTMKERSILKNKYYSLPDGILFRRLRHSSGTGGQPSAGAVLQLLPNCVDHHHRHHYDCLGPGQPLGRPDRGQESRP